MTSVVVPRWHTRAGLHVNILSMSIVERTLCRSVKWCVRRGSKGVQGGDFFGFLSSVAPEMISVSCTHPDLVPNTVATTCIWGFR